MEPNECQVVVYLECCYLHRIFDDHFVLFSGNLSQGQGQKTDVLGLSNILDNILSSLRLGRVEDEDGCRRRTLADERCPIQRHVIAIPVSSMEEDFQVKDKETATGEEFQFIIY